MSDHDTEIEAQEASEEARDVVTPPTVSGANAPAEPPQPVPIAPPEADAQNDAEVERQIHHISRRSFLWAGVAVASGFVGWQWLIHQRMVDGTLWPLRLGLEMNEQLARDYFKPSRLAPNFERSQAETPKQNGDYGLSEDFDPSTWKLQVYGIAAPQSEENNSEAATSPTEEKPRHFTLADIKKLPRVEMVTQLKCIEGWSVIVHWAGARLADFIAQYPPASIHSDSGEPADVKQHPQDLPGYVSLKTPDGGYYVGLEMESALHPQTLLCYEMNGEPLPLEHGAPLRLVIPVKYGIKNIKRIGTIRYTNERPADYWAEQGYDWYAGH